MNCQILTPRQGCERNPNLRKKKALIFGDTGHMT
jgi:hypothetical protein